MAEIMKCDPWNMDPGNLETCPLARACSRGELGPMMGRAAITNNTCAVTNEGRYCGGTTAYFEAVLDALYLDALDQVAPVTHTLRIISAPDGDAPDEVRKAVVGTSVYARQSLLPDGQNENFFAVHATDFLLALHADGKFDAASWYSTHHTLLRDTSKETPVWVFDRKDLEVYKVAKVTINSAEQYGNFAWSMVGLYAIWPGYLMHPEAFRPRSPKGKQYYEAMQQIADEEFDGDIQVAIRAHLRDTFASGSFSSMIERGKGRTLSADDEGLKTIIEDGKILFDRDNKVDFRNNPDDAPQPKERMIDRFRKKLEERQLSGQHPYTVKITDM